MDICLACTALTDPRRRGMIGLAVRGLSQLPPFPGGPQIADRLSRINSDREH